METVKQIDDIVSSMLEWVSVLTDELISESEKYPKEEQRAFIRGAAWMYPIEDAEDYMDEFILFKYSMQYQASELCEDILNMSKEGYNLTRFGYIPDSKCYVAKFSKYNTD
jgi:hypothetical protein